VYSAGGLKINVETIESEETCSIDVRIALMIKVLA